MTIRIIHQIWFDFDNSSRFKNQNCSTERIILKDSILKTNPSFRYILWSLEDAKRFIKIYYPEYLTFINCETNRPIIKCDFFRYLLLFHFGGFYMDLDFFVVKNLDELITKHNDKNIILARESYNCIEVHNTLHNGFIYASEPYCIFFKNLCDDIITHDVTSISEQDVYHITGTKLLCSSWIKYKDYYHIHVLPFHVVCSHWFINSNNDRKLFNVKNIHETCNDNTNSWSFLTIHDVNKNKKTLIDNGAYAICIIMNHVSYWK